MKKTVAFFMLTMTLCAGGSSVEALSPVTPIIPQERSQLSNKLNKYYLGAALSALSIRSSSGSLNFFSDKTNQDRVGNLMLLGGYNYNSYLAFEVRLTTTVAKATFAKYSGVSFFVKPKYSFNNGIDIYALLGLGYLDLTGHNNSNVNAKKTAFQWGVGTSYNIKKDTAIFLDYTSLAKNVKGDFLSEKKGDIDAINIGFTHSF